jgi:hypothetical protein
MPSVPPPDAGSSPLAQAYLRLGLERREVSASWLVCVPQESSRAGR